LDMHYIRPLEDTVNEDSNVGGGETIVNQDPGRGTITTQMIAQLSSPSLTGSDRESTSEFPEYNEPSGVMLGE